MSTNLSIEAASPEQTHHLKTLSAGWLVRRSVLWLAILAIGIGAACGLYSVAGEAGPTAPLAQHATIVH